jgi:hypothetical protein
MKITIRVLALFLVCATAPAVWAQVEKAKITKCGVEASGKSGNQTQNATVCYLWIGNTVYGVTRGVAKPDSNLVVGQTVQVRVTKHSMYIADEKGKETKYSIIREIALQ